jgi:hypothetical protein
MGATAIHPEDGHGDHQARDDLVAAIVEQVHRHGCYRVDLTPQPLQAIVDLRWAAQQAGRVLGHRLRACASTVGAREPDLVTMIVAPVEAWSTSGTAAHTHQAGRLSA